MNQEKLQKTISRNYFFELINNSVFRKTIGNIRNHKDIKLITTEERRNYLVSELNYHVTKVFLDHLLAIEIKRTQIK